MGKTIKDKAYSIDHTKLRLKQRYNIDIKTEDYNYICRQIQFNKNCLLVKVEKQKEDSQFIYDLVFKNHGVIRVVWSQERGYITTVLERK